MAEEGQAQAAPQAPQGQSFRERKASQLSGEREATPPELQPVFKQEPAQGTPRKETELAEQEVSDDDLVEDGEYEDEDEGRLAEDPEGIPDVAAADDSDEEGHDWQKRYKDLQAEYSRVTENRTEMEQEQAEAMGENLRLKFDLEDRLNEAVGRAEYMANVMSGNASQYKNINWAQVPPEQLPQVQAQAQQALQMEQQSQAAWAQVKQQTDEARQTLRGREAAIARTRLKRSIGLDNELYGKLHEHAVTRGMSSEEFKDITNPVVIEALHAQMQMMQAGNTVKANTQRNAKAPRGGRAVKRTPRNARGQFEKTQTVPNQRGSFADKHRHRLAMER